MAEQVNIASLTIDINDVEKQSVLLKKQIEGLKNAQKALDTTTDEGAAAYEALAGKIKNTSKAYKDNQAFASALDETNKDLTKTLQVEGKSTQELYDSRRQLNLIAKNIKGDTEEEVALRNQLNTAIDAQTQKIREQQSEFNAGKDQIGEYTKGINLANFNLKEFVVNVKESGGATNFLKGGLQGVISGMWTFTKATLAFLATPVGFVLAAIAGAFLLIKNAMNRSEESTIKIKKAFASFSGIIQGLFKILEPLGSFLIDGIVKGFELVEKGIFKALTAIQSGLKLLGLNEAAAKMGNFTTEIKEAASASKELVQAELDLQKAQRESRKIQLDYQKAAERLRQTRDDETKSFQERIEANKNLGQLLKEQAKEEEAIVQKAIDLANKRILLEGENETTLNSRAEALTELADIQERIASQESEQLTNKVSLEKEYTTYLKEEADKRNEQATKAREEAFAIAKKIREEEKALRQEIIDENDAEILPEIDKDTKRQLINAENRIAALELESENEFALKQSYLDRQRIAELEAAKKSGADKKLINEKYKLAEERIAADITAFKQQQNAQILSGLVSLFGESSKIGKAFAIAEIVNNTALNASKAFAQAAVFASNPLTLPLAFNANLQGGLIVALGAAQVAKTSGLKLAGGGMVRGAGSGKSDSIPALLSNGESINNANSTRMFAPLYSYLNELGGGSRFASGGIAGSSSSSSASIIDYDILAAKMSEAYASLPAPQVSVEEINTVSKNIQVIENLATG